MSSGPIWCDQILCVDLQCDCHVDEAALQVTSTQTAAQVKLHILMVQV